MYNSSKVKRLINEAQSEIDAIIDKYEPLINDAIKKQIPKDHKFYCCMGASFCENKNGEIVGENFTRVINNLQYEDSFKTGMNIKNVNVKT
ncbi:hypothetical protein BPT24_151 [Tenacibaculum phage pT24]|uniref:Uncharacterized protein n=1 Tax=Tenacibaculum phage pT24 TaxID=1880590 RepID=A0A1B4XWW1_9CAUD|nr:hypothetical protein HYP10_gp151 [Tenacibaculum phage pT24]BAV39277.1 hypothetical protein BPT24_151 [Tenacibaculum phage pT24]